MADSFKHGMGRGHGSKYGTTWRGGGDPLPTYPSAGSPPAAYPLPTYPFAPDPTLPYPARVPNPARDTRRNPSGRVDVHGSRCCSARLRAP